MRFHRFLQLRLDEGEGFSAGAAIVGVLHNERTLFDIESHAGVISTRLHDVGGGSGRRRQLPAEIELRVVLDDNRFARGDQNQPGRTGKEVGNIAGVGAAILLDRKNVVAPRCVEARIEGLHPGPERPTPDRLQLRILVTLSDDLELQWFEASGLGPSGCLH